MLALIVDGVTLDLDDRATITIQAFNPALDSDSIAGRFFSFPFRLPCTGRNLHALLHPHRVDAAPTDKKRAATLLLDAAQFRGFLELGERSPESIEVTFRDGARQALADVENLKINEILDNEAIEQNTIAQWVFEADAGASSYNLSINGFGYTGSGAWPDGLINLANAINADLPGTAQPNPSNNTLTLTPTAQPYAVDPNGVGSTNLTLLGWNNFATARRTNFHTYYDTLRGAPIFSHGLPVVYAPFFLPLTALPNLSDYLNYWHDGNEGRNVREDTPVWQYSFVPCVRLAYVLSKIAERTDAFAVYSGFYDDAGVQSLMFYEPLDISEVIYDFFSDGPEFGYGYLNAHRASFALNDHVPPLGCAAFVAGFVKLLNCYFSQEGTTLRLRKKIEQLQNTPVDWSDKIAPGYTLTRDARRGALLKFKSDTTDALDTGSLADYQTGYGGGTVLEMDFRPLQEFSLGDQNALWKLAGSGAPGGSDAGGFGRREAGTPRVFFDLGLQQDDNGGNYWMSSQQGKNTAGDPVVDWSLQWSGETGLYETFFKGWAEMIADAPTLRIPMRLEGSDVAELMRWNNPLRRFKTELGEVRVLVKSFDFRCMVGSEKAETVVECLVL
jgi:hypothetical protein